MQGIPHAELELPQESRSILAIVEEAGGFIPNSFYVMARRPKMLRAITDLCMTVLVDEGEVPKDLRWLVGHVASRAAGCRYCTAHTATNAAHLAGLSEDKVADAWNYSSSPLFTPAERAAMDFAIAAASVPNSVEPQHFVSMREHFTDDQIIEIMSVIALFGWFNRWNDSMATELEDEPMTFASTNLQSSGWQPPSAT